MRKHLLSVICISFFIFIFSVFLCYSQETTKEEDKAIDLPPVKIEIVDATQINIPKEKFDGLTKPDYDIYVSLSHKERLWYLPSTAIPEKYKYKSASPDKDFLLSLSAYPGLPISLAYQVLLMKGFGNSQVLADLGRMSLLSDRTAKFSGNHEKKQSGSTIDKFSGFFSSQTKNSSFRTELNYNAKNFDYLDVNGEKYETNDRSLLGLSLGFNYILPNRFEPYINADIKKLIMDGPLPSDSNDALKVNIDASTRAFLSPSIPINAGIKIENFIGNGADEDFRDALIRLYFNDNRIRLWPFILSVGFELAIDSNKSSLTKDGRKTSLYPNPYILLTSQLGSKIVLQFGLERYILNHEIESLYLKNDYIIFNPSLKPERAWNINGLLKYNLMKKFNAKIGFFDKEISDLPYISEFENSDGISNNRIIYYKPVNLENAHISGINAGWEMSLLDNRLNQSFEYVHEFYNEDIPYRPKDKGVLALTYLAPSDFVISLMAELYGKRDTGSINKGVQVGDIKSNTSNTKEANSAETDLPLYIILKPKLSKSFGKNAEVSLSFGFYMGKGDYQILKGYSLPKQTMDIGISIKF